MCYNRIVLGGSDYNRSTLARFFTQNGKVAKLLKVNKQQMPRVFLLRAFCSF